MSATITQLGTKRPTWLITCRQCPALQTRVHTHTDAETVKAHHDRRHTKGDA